MTVEKPMQNLVPLARWGQERRLEFIDFRLLWEGRVNRSDLTNYFGISIPQASTDLSKYQELAPSNMFYDKQLRTYVAEAQFLPLMGSLNAYSFLNAIRQVDGQMLAKDSTFLGWVPSHAVVRLPARTVEVSTLRDSLQAIRAGTKLRITYQSMNRPLPTERYISPHAIAFDGIRWHVRGYCFERHDFRDFVISRIVAIQTTAELGVDPSQDHSWSSEVRVSVEPVPHLTVGQRRAIELDYGMVEGKLEFRVREAMLLYLLQQLPLYSQEGKLRHNQLVLSNRSELKPVLQKLGIDL
jgi:hypothetical protein